MANAGKVVAALEISLGVITLEVEIDRAPITGGDFLRYVKEERFAGGAFYRVVSADNDSVAPAISVIQGGVIDERKLLPPIAHEPTSETGLRHLAGTLSVGRNAPGSGTAAAFFICVEDCPSLDFGGLRNPDGQGFAAFGKVIEGMDVVRQIHSLPTGEVAPAPALSNQILTNPIRIVSAWVITD